MFTKLELGLVLLNGKITQEFQVLCSLLFQDLGLQPCGQDQSEPVPAHSFIAELLNFHGFKPISTTVKHLARLLRYIVFAFSVGDRPGMGRDSEKVTIEDRYVDSGWFHEESRLHGS